MSDPDLRVLARFLPELARADFLPGGWTEAQKQEDGAFTVPYTTLSPVASEFVQAAYDGGWVLQGFDWSEWGNTQEAVSFYHNPSSLVEATPRQLAQLLTLLIRRDRFVEGGLLEDFKSGRILAIVRRAAKLVETRNTPPSP